MYEAAAVPLFFRLRSNSLIRMAATDYHIDGRAYGRLLFDTNMCLERSDGLIRLGRTYPNQLVSRILI